VVNHVSVLITEGDMTVIISLTANFGRLKFHVYPRLIFSRPYLVRYGRAIGTLLRLSSVVVCDVMYCG